jgi:predicted DNA binding CopG/RHH family protein
MTTTEHRGPGRPSTGVRVDIRIPADLLTQIDAEAELDGITRAELIRGILSHWSVQAGH